MSQKIDMLLGNDDLLFQCYHVYYIQILTIAIHIQSLIMPLFYSFSMFHSTSGHHQGAINELIREIISYTAAVLSIMPNLNTVQYH